VSTEGVILVVVAVAGVGAFLIGVLLLLLYFRYNRGEEEYEDEPVMYGNLIQCPACGYMNPMDTAACLNCRQPLAHPRPIAVQPAARQQEYWYAPTLPPTPSPEMTVQSSVRPATPPPPAPLPVAPTIQPSPPPPVPAADGASDFAGEMPTAWLEGVGGAMMGHRAVLQQVDTLVGRSTACDVQVYDPKVSRKHFLIRYANGAFFLQDQQSSRGTRINGQRVMAQRLKDGDHIEIGDSGMVFHLEAQK